MKIADVSIKNPVFISMAVLAVIVLGLLSYRVLPVELFPDIALPIVSVSTPYPGASPEDVESQLTKPIEEALSVLKGVKKIRSTSTEGVSIVVVEFELELSAKEMAAEVREKVQSIRRTLPRDALDPQYEKFDPSDQPIMSYALTANVEGLSPSDLRYLVDKKVIPFLERLDGVASISLSGGEEREIEVAIRRADLERFGISISDVTRTIQGANIEVPGGRITTGTQEFLLKTQARIGDPQELDSLVVKVVNGLPIRIRDFATIRDTFKESRLYSRANGAPSVMMDIRKQSGSNTVAVARRIRDEVNRLQKEIPQVKANLALDDSDFIRASRDDVVVSLLEGIVLASLVVLFFFRDIRSTIITVIGLPVCLIGTFIAIKAFGYTINVLTLMALSLSIGLLIDDAIVVRENIFRWIERGVSPGKAARDATGEVALAVLATTLTVVAVFLPIAFTSGISGKFFRQFGLTITIAVLISLIEAFTVAPMLSAFFFKEKKKSAKGPGLLERFFRSLETGYRSLLQWALGHRALVIIIATVVMLASVGVVPLVGVAGDSHGDRGQFSIVIEGPMGISLQEMNQRVLEVERLVKLHPKVKDLFTTVGATDGAANQAAIMVGVGEINISKQVISEMRPTVQGLPGLNISFEEVAGIRNKNATIMQRPIQINLQGPDIATLTKVSNDLMNQIKDVPGLRDLDKSQRSGKREFQYRVKRENLGRYGVTAAEVGAAVRTMVNGDLATYYKDGEDNIEVNVRFIEGDRRSPIELLNTLYTLKSGQVVPLSELIDLTEATGPASISRQDRSRQVVIVANTFQRNLNEIQADISSRIDSYPLPTGYVVKYEGQVSQNKESFTTLFIALALAILFVYMVLASQFNSFLHPLTIMLALPLSLIGGFFGLLLAHKAFDMLAFIGLIMLMGVVTKNSILLVDFTNRMRREGKSIHDALLEAGPIRLRPILMTTLAMVFGMLPTALGLGASSAFRVGLAVMVIGGLISSTALTLVIVPVAYDILESIKRKLGFKETFAKVE